MSMLCIWMMMMMMIGKKNRFKYNNNNKKNYYPFFQCTFCYIEKKEIIPFSVRDHHSDRRQVSQWYMLVLQIFSHMVWLLLTILRTEILQYLQYTGKCCSNRKEKKTTNHRPNIQSVSIPFISNWNNWWFINGRLHCTYDGQINGIEFQMP